MPTATKRATKDKVIIEELNIHLKKLKQTNLKAYTELLKDFTAHVKRVLADSLVNL